MDRPSKEDSPDATYTLVVFGVETTSSLNKHLSWASYDAIHAIVKVRRITEIVKIANNVYEFPVAERRNKS